VDVHLAELQMAKSFDCREYTEPNKEHLLLLSRLNLKLPPQTKARASRQKTCNGPN